MQSPIVNDKVLEIEAGMGQQPHVNGRDVHLPSQCQTDGSDNARPQSPGSGPYQKQSQQQGDNQSHHAGFGSHES